MEFKIDARIFNQLEDVTNLLHSLSDQKNKIFDHLFQAHIFQNKIGYLKLFDEKNQLKKDSIEYQTLKEEYQQNIIKIKRIPAESLLEHALFCWYDGFENMLENIRDAWQDPNTKDIYFVTGVGYDTISSDLLNDQANGQMTEQFLNFLNNPEYAKLEQLIHEIYNYPIGILNYDEDTFLEKSTVQEALESGGGFTLEIYNRNICLYDMDGYGPIEDYPEHIYQDEAFHELGTNLEEILENLNDFTEYFMDESDDYSKDFLYYYPMSERKELLNMKETKPYTIKELAQELNLAIEAGHGDKRIMLFEGQDLKQIRPLINGLTLMDDNTSDALYTLQMYPERLDAEYHILLG